MTELEVIDLTAAQDSADRVSAFWQRTVEGIRGMCREVAAARASLTPTEFRLMWHDQDTHVERPIPLSYRAGQMLAKVGENSALMETKYISLPSSWGSWVQLDRLQRFDHDRFIAAVEAGDIHPGSEQRDLAQLLAKWRFTRRQLAFHDYAATSGERWTMHRGDFRDIDVGEPVDCVLTDPPYGDEYLELWGDLAAWAATQLRVGGVLLAWSGVQRLPLILPALSEHLRYGWTLKLDLPGTQSRVVGASMFQTWKPVLVYVKDRWPPHDWGPDALRSPQREKSRYEWEQNIEPAVDALDRFCSPGGLVVDPFCGTGTFGVAALRTGRRFVGVEQDIGRHDQACERLAS